MSRIGRMSTPVIALLAALTAGCVSYYPVETTPEGILSTIGSGDVVRMTTRDRGAIEMRVWSVSDEHVRGKVEPEQELVDVRLDLIESLEIERPDLKKAMLRILLPAVVGVALLCKHQDCESHSILTATF